MTKDEYVKRLEMIIRAGYEYVNKYRDRNDAVTKDYIAAIQALNDEVIGQTDILIKPEPIQGVDQLWLAGRATGELVTRQELRQVIGKDR